MEPATATVQASGPVKTTYSTRDFSLARQSERPYEVRALISIGRSGSASLVDLLIECHQRIRKFSRLARDCGCEQDIPANDIVEACLACQRYFTQALPLHVEDEERSILPRLAVFPEVAPALETMRSQHAAHQPSIEQLLGCLEASGDDPANQRKRQQLHQVASNLVDEFEEHLCLEETLIFPAIDRSLSPDQQLAIIGELRARRR